MKLPTRVTEMTEPEAGKRYVSACHASPPRADQAASHLCLTKLIG
jgi:hypothetical protein